MNLCDELTIRMLLERHGFHFSKSMGQNFLIDPQIPADIAAASQADETCGVLEIGPGIGPLTSELAQRAGKVVSIELDRALLPILAETMAPYSNVEIVPGDVTRLDLKALIDEKFAGLRPIVCANLPYNITTPVLTALTDIPAIESVTVLIQKEAAQRLTSAKGSADGAFPLRLQYEMETECLFDVPPEKFLPAPKVTSTVLRCVRRWPSGMRRFSSGSSREPSCCGEKPCPIPCPLPCRGGTRPPLPTPSPPVACLHRSGERR